MRNVPRRPLGGESIPLLWVTWVLATLAGGILFAVIIHLGWSLVAEPQVSWGYTVGYVFGILGYTFGIFLCPFIAFAVAAFPQALVIRQLTAPQQRSARVRGWVKASTLGGVLYIGYLLAYLIGPVNVDEIRSFYGPVTAIVGLLITTAQALALRRNVTYAGLIVYVPLTTVAWVIGWSLCLLNSFGTGISTYLWFTAPFLCIGIASGLVLAPQLSAHRNVLEHAQ